VDGRDEAPSSGLRAPREEERRSRGRPAARRGQPRLKTRQRRAAWRQRRWAPAAAKARATRAPWGGRLRRALRRRRPSCRRPGKEVRARS